MRLAHQFQGQTVKGQGYGRAGEYRVGRSRQPHCLLSLTSASELIWKYSVLCILCYLRQNVCGMTSEQVRDVFIADMAGTTACFACIHTFADDLLISHLNSVHNSLQTRM